MVEFVKPLEISIGEDEEEWSAFPHTYQNTPPPKGPMPKQPHDFGEIDAFLQMSQEAGYILRSVVVERKLGRYQRTEGARWGVITRIDRYWSGPQTELFRPIGVEFVNQSTLKYFSPNELFIIYKGLPYESIAQSIEQQEVKEIKCPG